jgi:hypothetical protein
MGCSTAQAQDGLQHGDQGQHPQQEVQEQRLSAAQRPCRGRRGEMEAHHPPAVAAGRRAQLRRGVVQRPDGAPGLVVDRRRTEEVGVGLPGVQAQDVAHQLVQQVAAAARIAAVDRRVGIFVGVQVVVVQPVRDAVGAHRDAADHADEAAGQVVGAAVGQQPVVRRFVREDEQAVLRDADHEDAGEDPCAGPGGQRQCDGRRDPAESLGDGEQRARRGQAGERRELRRRQQPPCLGVARARRAQVLAELLAGARHRCHGLRPA